MKQKIHPKYFDNAVFTCACGNKMIIGSTKERISVELCSKCHPFYTGKQRIVDTENLVKKFEAKVKSGKGKDYVSKKAKRAKQRAKVTKIEPQKTLTLKDMLKQLNNK